MALTWEFYVAIILVIVALLVVVLFVFLLLHPETDFFDKVRGFFMSKDKKQTNQQMNDSSNGFIKKM